MEAVLEVAEEQSEAFSWELELESNCVQEEGSFPMVTRATVEDVCKTLAKDVLLPKVVREAAEKLNYVDLQNALSFQEHCLVPGRFINAAMEKAWGKYNAAYLDHKSEVTQVTKHSGAAAWISMKVFQRLVSEAYTKGKANENVECAAEEISDHEKSTVRYIAGAVVKKLKERTFGLKKTESRDAMLDCLDAMTCQSEPEAGMTTLLTRGGLIHVRPDIAEMFYMAESLFLQLGGSGSEFRKINASQFVSTALGNRSLTSCLDQCLSEHESSVKEALLVKVLELYFKIRIHHKMKCLMDKIHLDENTAKKEKGLRKTLKMKLSQ